MCVSRFLLCAAALLWIPRSGADNDEHLLQREVTFDPDNIMQEIQNPEWLLSQREVDLTEGLDAADFFTKEINVHQEEMFEGPSDTGASDPRVLTPRGRHPAFGPRSSAPLMDYPVEFPPARPTPDNLASICQHGSRRPRYPPSYFPSGGFGQLKRRAGAVNRAESWFDTCCERNGTSEAEEQLCCATQAWEQSLRTFCEEDSSVKDRLYHCCKHIGAARLKCFDRAAPNPGYAPTQELPLPPLASQEPFTFDPSSCQTGTAKLGKASRARGKKEKKPLGSLKVDINFPPGRPSGASIEALCRDQKARPLYSTKCLPAEGYDVLALQAKSVNRLEKKLKQCCKKRHNVLSCAEQKWQDELDKFCNVKGEKTDFSCCSAGVPDDRYDCFHDLSPDPHYNLTSASEEPALTRICDVHKIIKKKFPVGFPLKSFLSDCCPLPLEEQTACMDQKIKETSGQVCSLKKKKTTPPAVRRCCRVVGEETQTCISEILMDAVTKAIKIFRQKKKRCPLS